MIYEWLPLLVACISLLSYRLILHPSHAQRHGVCVWWKLVWYNLAKGESLCGYWWCVTPSSDSFFLFLMTRILFSWTSDDTHYNVTLHREEVSFCHRLRLASKYWTRTLSQDELCCNLLVSCRSDACQCGAIWKRRQRWTRKIEITRKTSYLRKRPSPWETFLVSRWNLDRHEIQIYEYYLEHVISCKENKN